MIVWIDGLLVAAGTARIDPRDRGFMLGDGLYETIRVRQGEILRLDRHFARLAAGLELLDFPLAADPAMLERGVRAVLDANRLAEAAVRLTVSRGVSARGMAPDPKAKPTIVISATPYTPPVPVRLIIATGTRRNEHSPTARVKTTSCLDSILARIEAARAGMDDAILLNSAGCVAEATAANIFAVLDGVPVTPPVSDGALPGVMREQIVGRQKVEERTLSAADLDRAEEIFLTSSLGIRPVISLEGRPLPVGPLATRLAGEI